METKEPMNAALTEEEQRQTFETLTDTQKKYWETWSATQDAKERERYYNADGTERSYYGFMGGPRLPYKEKVAGLNRRDLADELESNLYMSAMCAGNRHPCDWSWMVDECYDEMMRRTMTDDWYDRVYKRLVREYSD